MKKVAISFLIQCYFGDTTDPYLAAIDKAYFDMQTHTISGDKKIIYAMRREETEYLYSQLRKLPSEVQSEKDFDKWHKDTSDKMKTISKKTIELEYGQIQKWINMSIKYLYTLRALGDEKVNQYFVENVYYFHAPLDSYVLNEIGNHDTWSTIPTYEIYKNIQGNITFEKEYKEWPEYARKAKLKKNNKEKLADKGSYKRYIQDNYSNKDKTYCGEIRWRTTE